jgi:hypothetical protein
LSFRHFVFCWYPVLGNFGLSGMRKIAVLDL